MKEIEEKKLLIKIYYLRKWLKQMDNFKRKSNKEATSWDWNIPKYVKRYKGNTQILHRLSRRRLKRELKREVKESD